MGSREWWSRPDWSDRARSSDGVTFAASEKMGPAEHENEKQDGMDGQKSKVKIQNSRYQISAMAGC